MLGTGLGIRWYTRQTPAFTELSVFLGRKIQKHGVTIKGDEGGHTFGKHIAGGPIIV